MLTAKSWFNHMICTESFINGTKFFTNGTESLTKGTEHFRNDDELRDRKKNFRNFLKIMCPTLLHTPGPHKSIAPNSDSKFEREHAFRSVFRFSSPWDYIWTKIEKRFEKRNFEFRVGVWSNRFVGAWGMQQCWAHNFKKISKTFFTIP